MARGGPLAAWLGPALREENHDHHRSNGSSRPGEPRQWDLPPCSRAPPAIRAACLVLAQRTAALAQAPFFIRPVTPHALPPPSQRQELRQVEHPQPALGAGLHTGEEVLEYPSGLSPMRPIRTENGYRIRDLFC